MAPGTSGAEHWVLCVVSSRRQRRSIPMTSRLRLLVALVLAPAAAALWAADKDFWDQKPYTEWNEKEVDKMMKSSPWAKTMTFASAMGRGEMSGVDGEGGFG